MNDYKEMREGKILLNRFPYNECKDFRRQSQHEKENLYFTTNDDGFFVKMYEAVGNPEVDEVEITRYYPDSDKKEVRLILSPPFFQSTKNDKSRFLNKLKLLDKDKLNLG